MALGEAGCAPMSTTLVLPGPVAFAPGRLTKRLGQLAGRNPGVRGLAAAYVHFVDLAAPLEAAARATLDRLLQYGPRREPVALPGARRLLVVPRLGTIPPGPR